MNRNPLVRLSLCMLLALCALGAALVMLGQPSAQARTLAATTRTYPGASPCDTTLQACISASADGDIVQIAANTYLTTSLSITRAVSLVGGGTNPSDVKLRPTGGRMILYSAVPLTATFVISNLTVENGNTAAASGGGIRVSSGAIPLFHSLVISNNIAAGGGGIRIIPNSPATMVNVTLISNTSSTDAGGISASGSLTLVNSRLESNSALANGGSAAVAGELTLFNTVAQSNTAGSQGGAFFAAAATLSNSLILSNTADNGGGVYVQNGLRISDTLFDRNLAAAGSGGSIYSENLLVTIMLEGSGSVTKTIISHSQALTNGGGIFAAGSVKLIGEVSFSQNTALNGEGGAVYTKLLNDASGNSINLAVTFLTNSAKGNGGAVRATDQVMLLNSPLFQNNTAGNGALADGGGIYADGPVFLERGSSTGNTARNGGAVYGAGDIAFIQHDTGPNTAAENGGCAYSRKTITYFSAVATGCVAGQNGGAAFSPSTVTLNGSIVSLFNLNRAGNLGGLAFANIVVVRNATVVSNTATLGGALAATTTLDIAGSSFISNTAATFGGAAVANGSALITGSVFTSNRVTGTNGMGGAVWVTGTLNITNSTFLTNSALFGAGSQGGAIGAAGRLSLLGDIFQGNAATTGGAVHGLADVFATNSNLTGNGGIGVASAGGIAAITVTISSVTFTQNIACCGNSAGGAISATVANINNGVFIQNSASISGGAVLAGQVFITGSQFFSNTSSGDGSGVWTGGGLITNTQFTANFSSCCAGHAGGAVFAQGRLDVYGSQFTGNRSDDGGALVLKGFRSEIHDGTFVDNVGSAGGGAIDASSFGPFIYNSTFSGNRSGSGGGGAIRALNNNLYVEASTFSNNSANGGDGGAILTTVGRGDGAIVTASTFISNFAASGGGALFSKHADIENSTFISNHVASFGSGGAVAVSGGFLFGGNFIGGSSFTDNRVDLPAGSCGSGMGGAVYLDPLGSLTVQSSGFTRSSAPQGGALFAAGSITLELSAFSDNSAVCLSSPTFSNVGFGGALAAQANLTVKRSTFLRNSAGSVGGGALAFLPLSASPLRVENSLFARNVATNTVFGAGGAAIVISQTATTGELFFNTFTDQPRNPVSAIAVYSGTVSVVDNIISGHATGIELFGGTAFEDFNLFFDNGANLSLGVTPGGSSLPNSNPLFVAPGSDNYHLQSGSPAIDHGSDLGITSDFDGDPRPIGPKVDIGFDERKPLDTFVYLPLIQR
jgi:predicted outer membrane repeat protein